VKRRIRFALPIALALAAGLLGATNALRAHTLVGASSYTPRQTTSKRAARPRAAYAALPTYTPAPLLGGASAATSTISAMARPTATPSAGPTLPPVYYRDGSSVYAVYPDGSGRTLVATSPVSPALPQPRLLPDGRLLYATGSGFAAVDRYGRNEGIRVPDLNAGEAVWSVTPAPDGKTLAWQLFAPANVDGATVNTGSGRIVLTGRFGDPGIPVFMGQASGRDGQVPVLVGWRGSSPYGAGGPTLLLQNLYSANDAPARIALNAERGLLEYDPTIGDVVNDYLPPGGGDIPLQRAFTVSGDGRWTVYGDDNALTPSGEGPLARSIVALNLDTNAVAPLDATRNYSDTGSITTTRKIRVGTRDVTIRTTTTLRLYQYFSHNAYIAPGDGRVLYTRLTVSYPPDARVPHVDRQVIVASMDGRSHTVVARDAEGVGWLNGTVAVLKRPDGLYSVDVVSGVSAKIAAGAGTRFIGVR